MKVIVATKNPGKIEGVKIAFENYYDEIEIQGIPVASDISDQPLNDEIYIGAKNRVNNLKKYCSDNNIQADFYVSIESGITNQLGRWMIVNIAVIEDNNNYESYGSSAGFPVPEKYVDEIISTELGKVMDRIFDETELRAGKGGINLLTRDKISRIDLTEQAFIMALTKYINGDTWK
ncbi:MAG: inosine/xanthosine triphosphatase [Clostridia bacterium]|nr:inosine/xanthosine triphosphatase [Clostridia bacterium]MDD4387468.1 inosine/xanthosine triphosphatase [Clostridia bacterium]